MVKINIYTLDTSLSTLFIMKKDIIFITIYQKKQKKNINKSKSNSKRLFNNTLLSIKAIRIVKLI